ncbi:uncharacterized protein C8Q71DRAFT_774634 [Rhodofomes roseus]|uniref:Secreted protein n=1 Tax=Rhodofomes roseus TaxID=34475 RepID=A0ABQ8K7Q7_9APHY|nr:uncharacterized protein C8Q71DRAFT_774634 [Rhodofomes roseus]KAH9833207.1 hypothetical protein C8Q71DRAFT_774634 [Rhodofomes roseus]
MVMPPGLAILLQYAGRLLTTGGIPKQAMVKLKPTIRLVTVSRPRRPQDGSLTRRHIVLSNTMNSICEVIWALRLIPPSTATQAEWRRSTQS